MSYLPSSSFNFRVPPRNGNSVVPPLADKLTFPGPAADGAIDAALRAVPLPDGLLTRLRRLIHSISDDSSDQVDWLGC
jgi:hypothetical protein